MTKAKICGLTRTEDIECANRVKPDFIGMVFYAKSKRAVTAEQAATLKAKLDQKIKAVGVFVNNEIDFIAHLAQAGIIDIIQLHGDEDGAYIQRLREALPKPNMPIIKAIRVRSEVSLEDLAKYQVDYFLFDTYKAGLYGGTGERFNLELESIHIPKPYFIAGGLDASNIAEIIAANPKAFAVDVSGGVEDSVTGLKNPQKMADFVAQVRQNS
ncbi:MAG: phosphoribosylanthranilate isomerase [Phascolarctobacterium sp.]